MKVCYSFKEMSQILDCTQKTVRARLNKLNIPFYPTSKSKGEVKQVFLSDIKENAPMVYASMLELESLQNYVKQQQEQVELLLNSKE